MAKKQLLSLPIHVHIANWLRMIGDTKPDRPQFMSDEERDFNVMLIEEEVGELLDALKSNNSISEICDGGFDSIWVITQALMKCGININDMIRAGAESNMSKAASTEEEAIKTVDAYRNGTHPNKMGHSIETYYEQNDEGDYIIKRCSDDKILKALSFKDPDFSFIEKRLGQKV